MDEINKEEQVVSTLSNEQEVKTEIEMPQESHISEKPEKKCKCNCSAVVSYLSLIFSAIAIALIVLNIFGVFSKESKPQEKTIFDIPQTANDSSTEIAYIDLDTLLLNYNYSVKLQEDLLVEQKKAESSVEGRVKKLEEKYAAFMEKERTGMFLSAASRDAQQNEIISEQKTIEEFQQNLSNKLLEKQAAMNKEIYDTVVNFVNQYCTGRYKIILGNTAGSIVVYSKQGMNITKDVVTKLNQRYGGPVVSETEK